MSAPNAATIRRTRDVEIPGLESLSALYYIVKDEGVSKMIGELRAVQKEVQAEIEIAGTLADAERIYEEVQASKVEIETIKSQAEGIIGEAEDRAREIELTAKNNAETRLAEVASKEGALSEERGKFDKEVKRNATLLAASNKDLSAREAAAITKSQQLATREMSLSQGEADLNRRMTALKKAAA